MNEPLNCPHCKRRRGTDDDFDYAMCYNEPIPDVCFNSEACRPVPAESYVISRDYNFKEVLQN